MIGDIAYLSWNDANIHILDYTTPANPVYIGAFQLTMGGEIKELSSTASGLTVFQDGRITWLDASNATVLQSMGSATYQGNHVSCLMSGDYTYVLSSDGNLYCWNTVDSNAPQLVETVQLSNPTFGRLAKQGNKIYLESEEDWTVYDVSNPSAITFLGSVPGTSDKYIAAYDNQHIFGLDENLTLSIYSEGTGSELILNSSTNLVYGNYVHQICVGEGYLIISYVNAVPHNIQYCYDFINISNPSAPTIIREVSYQGGNIELCANHFFDLSLSISLYLVGTGGATFLAQGAYIQGMIKDIAQNTNYLIVKDSYGYIKVLDNLQAPEPTVRDVVTADNVSNITASDDKLFVSVEYFDDWGSPYDSANLKAYNLSQTGNLQYLYNHNFPYSYYPFECTSGQIVGQIGYFAVTGNLFITNVSSLTGMQQISVFTGYSINYLHVQGEYAYCGGYRDGGYKLLIISLADLSAPALVSMLPVPYTVGAIGVRGNRLFAGGGWGSLLVVDITNPESPTQELSIPLANPVVDISVGANHVTVATTNSLHVYDAGDGANVTSLGNYNTASEVNGMEVRGNLVYMAQDTCIGVYDISQAIGLSTAIPEEQVVSVVPLSVYPNPFKSGDGVTIEVPKMQQARISVYNLKGQKVFTSQEYSLRNELNTLSWNGCDSQAKPLPSGLYFLSVSSGNHKITKRITLIN